VSLVIDVVMGWKRNFAMWPWFGWLEKGGVGRQHNGHAAIMVPRPLK